jgi:hypothetical protein
MIGFRGFTGFALKVTKLAPFCLPSGVRWLCPAVLGPDFIGLCPGAGLAPLTV